jgi:hypothetical protein
VSGYIAIQSLRWYATNAEVFSSVIAVGLTSFTVLFPLGLFITFQKYLNPYFKRDRDAIEGRIDTLLVNVNERGFTTTMMTVFYPIMRELVAGVTVTTMYMRQFSVLAFMYSIVMALGYMLGTKRLKRDNYKSRLDLTILLYLTYLTVCLTDYVEDSIHYQSVSNQFMYGTIVLFAVTVA